MAVRAQTDPIEARVQALDPALLTSVVRRALESDSAEVVEWQVQPIVAGSARGSVFRLHGTAQDRTQMARWTLILKFVPALGSQFVKGSTPVSEDPNHYMYWLRELRVYESDLFDNLPDGLAAPRCFHTELQDDGYWLWLECIDDAFDGKWPVEHFGVAARHLGRFNGQYLAGREIPPYPWLVPPQQRTRSMEQHSRESNVWEQLPSLKEKHAILRRAWPGNLLEEFTRLVAQPEWLFQALESLPKTLKHGDAGHRNLLARRGRDGAIETVAIDWPFLGIGSIGEEIVPLVTSTVLWFGLPVNVLPELDRVVFDGYVQGLRDAGWHGDTGMARLGFTAFNVVQYAPAFGSRPEGGMLDERGRQRIEKLMFGHSAEEIADNCVVIRRQILAWADEARTLVDSV